MKIAARSLCILLEWLLVLVIVFVFAIRTSPVQTYLANKATDYLSKELKTTVKVDKVDIVFIDRVNLNGFLMLDEAKDTLASIESLAVTVSGVADFNKKIHLNGLELNGGVVKLNRNAIDGDFNFQFIKDYFRSDQPKTNQNQLVLEVEDVAINGTRFVYDDNRKTPIAKGMDYMHLDLQDVNLHATVFQVKNKIISADILSLSAKDKSGFVLDNFNATAQVSDNGVKVLNAVITTPQSTIYSSNFQFIYDRYGDFLSFVDNVKFDALIDSSDVSLTDVAYFAPQLWGMDQQVQLRSHITSTVADMKFSDVYMTTGEKTYVAGNFRLPDFRKFSTEFFDERITSAHIDIADLGKIKLPESSSQEYIILDPTLQRLGYFDAEDVKLTGFLNDFVVAANVVDTRLGSVNMNNGMEFIKNHANDSYLFSRSNSENQYDVKVNEFQFDQFMDNSLYGIVDGKFFLSGEAFSWSDIHFNDIEGDVNRFDLNGYSYTNIKVKEGSFIDNIFLAKVDVKDDNLELAYDGRIDLTGKDPHLKLTVDVKEAILDRLGITTSDSTSFKSHMEVDITGVDPNGMHGQVKLTGLVYKDGGKTFDIDEIIVDVTRGEVDKFDIESTVGDFLLEGKIDFDRLAENFGQQFAQIFPALYSTNKVKKNVKPSTDQFTYKLTTKNLNPVLNIFAPDLKIQSGTEISGNYNAANQNFDMSIKSGQVEYQNYVLNGIEANQTLFADRLEANYTIKELQLNDSITLNMVNLQTLGDGDNLQSKLSWNPGTTNQSEISWQTKFTSPQHIDFLLEPSYFSINNKRWDISEQAAINVDSTDLRVEHFKMTRGNQYILVNGHISRDDKEKLNFDFNEIDLNELGILLGLPTELEGKFNGWAYISNPYKNLSYLGDGSISGLKVDGEEIGDVFVQSGWDKSSENIELTGSIVYKDIQSFDFKGNYYMDRKEDNLDFFLDFDKTNIAFTNAFMDPDVVRDIRGTLDGELEVTGTLARPVIEGEVQLNNGSALIDMLGTNFYMNGEIYADRDGFYIDNMPIADEEGNTGSLIGSIYHSDYLNWNFDVSINLEEDGVKRDPLQPWKPLPLSKFLVMNTNYKGGELYYGKAYATGVVDIFGYADNLFITVDLETQKGTWINFPMYGTGEYEEGESFITILGGDSSQVDLTPKIDFTGVDLDLNFKVTDDAQMKIIFNEQLGDEIVAKGDGDIRIKMNNVGDLTMDGTYVIGEGGIYNFAMGPVKQPFYIDQGGSITWTGDPYSATLNLKTYYKVSASLAELTPDQISSGNQEVQCYLNLTESLMKPTIGFNIKVPKATESGKDLITKINSDQDELNRQFFSLLIFKKFQPMKGTNRSGGGAALDLVSNQINSILSQVSQDYQLNVNLDSDNLTGDNSLEFGVSKGFLDDRLIVTGSFGVENNNTTGSAHSSLIGNVNVEYKLNQSGSFRVNVFNESNDYSVIQDKNVGQFTQGAGLHYREDFDNIDDFKMIQYFLDIFRKEDNKKYPNKFHSERTPVPPKSDEEPTPEEGTIPEEN